ncbi:hypothetical protein CAEBREN_09403 [Caenorhabditis brenneri]|uniref:Uncharacterized protein n=1 Tax=Caenorhabditis brenneri TaxID=135651 RepID=G0NGG9_CAEBE|nr:hypothetical protein CAEBREN_09403 [Caenorhabditis brenneri]
MNSVFDYVARNANGPVKLEDDFLTMVIGAVRDKRYSKSKTTVVPNLCLLMAPMHPMRLALPPTSTRLLQLDPSATPTHPSPPLPVLASALPLFPTHLLPLDLHLAQAHPLTTISPLI